MKISLNHLPIAQLRHLHQLYQSLNSDIRLVGGCVRDTILGRPVLDIDLATPLPPDEGIALLKAHGIQVIATGLQHGTITAVVNHRPYEITTLRRDVETYGRHADVAFSTSWQEDAMRRDFTINGLYAHIDTGTIEDYHHGLDDLISGTIRFIGNPHERIQEDYLRILRYFRFYAWYGKTPLRDDILKIIQSHLRGLEKIARERVRSEFLKLIRGPKARSSLTYMIASKTIKYISSLPIHIDIPIEESELSGEALLYGLFIRHKEDIDRLTQELRLSNKQRHHLMALYQFDHSFDQESLNYLIYLLGREVVRDALYLRNDPYQAQTVESKKIPPFPIKGTDLPLPPGPSLGKILTECQKWWASQDFRPTRHECLTWIKNYLETSKR